MDQILNYFKLFNCIQHSFRHSKTHFAGGINDLRVEGFSLYTFISRWLILLSQIFLH